MELSLLFIFVLLALANALGNNAPSRSSRYWTDENADAFARQYDIPLYTDDDFQ